MYLRWTLFEFMIVEIPAKLLLHTLVHKVLRFLQIQRQCSKYGPLSHLLNAGPEKFLKLYAIGFRVAE